MTTSDDLRTPATAERPTAVLDTDEFVTSDGVNLHVCQNGPREAPALLLIHGTGASSRSWEPMLPLVTETHRVIRIDLAGCGRSSRPDDGDYGVPRQVGRIADALHQLAVPSVVVVGHSSGGVFATALADRHPDLVDGIVLINTGPRMSAHTAQQVRLPAPALSELTDDQIREAIRDGFQPGFAIPQAYVDQFREVDLGAFAAISGAIGSYLDERVLPERLTEVGKPLSVIFGEQDQRWDPSSVSDYRVVPGATITMLPGLGHSPNLEDPQRTAAALLTFTSAHATVVGSEQD